MAIRQQSKRKRSSRPRVPSGRSEVCSITGDLHREEMFGAGAKRFGRHSVVFRCKDCNRKGYAVIDPSKDIGW